MIQFPDLSLPCRKPEILRIQSFHVAAEAIHQQTREIPFQHHFAPREQCLRGSSTLLVHEVVATAPPPSPSRSLVAIRRAAGISLETQGDFETMGGITGLVSGPVYCTTGTGSPTLIESII